MANLFTQPENFGHTDWTTSRCTASADAILAPDGTMTGNSIADSTNDNTHTWFQDGFDLTSPKAVSIFVKQDELSEVGIYLDTSGKILAKFNVSAVALTSTLVTEGSIIATLAQAYDDGWVRFGLAGGNQLGPSDRFGFVLVKDGDESYAGNGTDNLYAWGALAEDGAVFNDYVSSAGVTVTLRGNPAANIEDTKPYCVNEIIGVDVYGVRVRSTIEFTPGTVVPGKNNNVLIYIKAIEAIASGDAVAVNTSFTASADSAGSYTAIYAIASGEWGWVAIGDLQ